MGIQIFGLIWIRIRMLVGFAPIQNVVDALSCRRQSFRQVWYRLL